MAGIFGNRIVERLWVGVTRRPVAFLTSSIILLTSSLLASCGPDGNQFEMSGKFKGFSQGELYLYATDGPSQKLDTIAVVNGTFEFTTTLDAPRTYIIVFPNFSELPVIGEPGEEVTIEGDVSHLREIDVDGTEENEILTKYRKKTSQLTPPEVAFSTEQFIKDNQEAFNYGALEEFGRRDDHFEEDGEIMISDYSRENAAGGDPEYEHTNC
jgi:hypothetical protein